MAIKRIKKVEVVKPARKAAAKVEEKPARRKRGEGTAPKAVEVIELSGKLAKLVATIDKAEAAVDAANRTRQEALGELSAALGKTATFAHPTLGPTTIMERNGVWFWRSKPTGAKGGVKKAAAKKVASKKAEVAPAKPTVVRRKKAEAPVSDDE